MKKVLNKMIIAILVFCAIIIISNISNASGGLRLRNLDYDVTLNSDGSANVVETWRISIEDTNTLFKTFEIDSSKYKEITDVKVQEVKSSGNVDFRKINQYKYHVDKNCYYALVYKGKFEIAWGVHAEDVTRTYKISYKIIDAVKNYNDCSEFYWQFVSTDSEIPANKVTGTIKLPNIVENLEDLRVWAHGPLNGNVKKDSNDTVSFEVEGLEENTMLEARIVTPRLVFGINNNTSNEYKLQSILEQEQEWADKANRRREEIRLRQENMRKTMITTCIVFNLIGLVLAVIIVKKIYKYHNKLKEIPKIKPEQEIEYYRDIEGNETPAEAAFIYYFKNTGIQYNMSKVISATMLDLCMKKHIEFEIVPNKKNQIKVILKKDFPEGLARDERLIYELLQKVASKETNSFTMKDFEKYASRHSSSVLGTFSKIEKIAKDLQEENGNYSKESVAKSNSWSTKGVGYVFLAILSVISMWLLIIPAIVAAVYSFKIASRYNTLTQKGVNRKEELQGLKKYMEEFSMIDDKTVPELVLWEKYLVYATVFGIADKVLKQLKVVYPQITEGDLAGYTYMYLMYSNNFNTSFLNTLNTSVTTSYHSATNYSSGSGGGGGFSSGGGFGGGGGRNGRKIDLLEQ
ncbi:MAG: DUF2207 domain-containing protein [Clostridia bacterium]|nr:DUF2207 domain-containing protein [Clostridia bacterium]